MKNNINLLGHPNVGKSTIFNTLTNKNARVSNFDGVTVEKSTGYSKILKKELVDLPGMISISDHTIIGKVVLDTILNDESKDYIYVIDITNIKKSLYLLIDILEANKNVKLAYTMNDLFKGEFNKELFAELFGCTNLDFDNEFNQVKSTFSLDYNEVIEDTIRKMIPFINHDNKRFIAIQILKGVCDFDHLLSDDVYVHGIRTKLEKHIVDNKLSNSISGYLFLQRRDYINSILEKTYQKERSLNQKEMFFDKIVLHNTLGYLVFLVVMFLVFFISFSFGFLGDYIENFILVIAGIITSGLELINAPEIIIDFMNEGFFAGIIGIFVFIPQIIILFTLLTFLEGIGYLSRVTILFENLFNKLGLSAHSIIPYLSGIGCNVLGIMATRSIKKEEHRIATILTLPFVSCAARIPIYVIFIEIFFESNKALVMTFLYFLGIIVAITVAFIITKLYKVKSADFNVFSLPVYRKVSFAFIYKIVKLKILMFIKSAGTLIFVGTLIIWLLSSFGMNGYTSDPSNSFLTGASEFLAIFLIPLGFGNPEAAGSLVAAFLAKELAISSMIVLYGVESISQLNVVLSSVYTPASAMSFMVFSLLYIPCLSVLGVIYSETKQKKMVVYSIVMSLTIGYVLAFVTYHAVDFFL